jgi:hypothetical protein
MSHVTQRSVPYILTQDQCGDHTSTCSDLINSDDKDRTSLNRIIIGHEKWCILHDPQLKCQIGNLEITTIAKKEETATGLGKGKVMLELFLNSSGTVHIGPQQALCLLVKEERC